MKKIFISLSLIVASAIVSNVNAQAVDQLSIIQSIGEGSIFNKYWGIAIENGTTTGQMSSSKAELAFVKNVLDKTSAFEFVEPGTDKTLINSGFGFLEPNHMTKPSVFHSDRHNQAYVMINGLMYSLLKVKDPQNITSFTIDEIYVLSKATSGDQLSGKLATKEMKTRNHEEVLKTYFSEMKKVQEAATANFTEEEKNEDLMIKQAKIDKDNGIQAKNAAYWNSEEGQRVLAKSREPEVTIVNDTQGSVYLCYGSGAYTDLKPGQKKTFACSGGTVYRGTLRPNNSSQYDKTNNVLLELNGKDCGRTVNASSVIK